MKQLTTLILAWLCIAAIATSEIKLRASSGKVVTYKPSATKPTVLIFVLSDCPIANNYAPKIGRLATKYSKLFDLKLVFEDPEISLKTAKKHMSDYAIKLPFLLDPKHKLASKMRVRISPEVVIQNRGKRVYLGRIDDQYAELGVRRPEASVHDLRNALEAILNHKPVQQPKDQPVGCILPK